MHHNRAGRRRPSGTDRARELRRVNNASIPNFILWDFLDGGTDCTTARQRLERTTAEGVLWAGELAVQQAHKAVSEDEQLECIGSAKELFERVQKQTKFNGEQALESRRLAARARLQSLLLPVHALIVLDGKLPTRATAERVYEGTVGIAYELSELRKTTTSTKDTRGAKGMIWSDTNKFTALSLLERRGLRISTESSFPVLSHPSEQRSNTHGTSKNHGWDITVLSGLVSPPAVDYRVKVRANGHDPIKPILEDVSGISLVCVDPDLRVGESEKFVASRIIDDLLLEIGGTGNIEPITARLDVREEMLLDRLAA